MINMFHLYGRKKQIVKHYPMPLHDTIIEPFAGSASYSLYYYSKNVILYEKDPVIYGIWEYIINESTPERILSLPILETGDRIDDAKFSCHNLTIPEKNLIGYFIAVASRPHKLPSPTLGYNKWTIKNRKKLSEDILKVKHWKVYNQSYETSNNESATWFIDPPYQGKGGKEYKCSNRDINYGDLAEFCLSRNGQIIVCENEEANWLPFTYLLRVTQSGRKHNEMIFNN